ncbi:hypothetical protein IW262DRAFT_1454846 [Armillaria fumosa]|nr:hypothetical protein IW262DRAFT_1454846 [Armillaria fumosa]
MARATSKKVSERANSTARRAKAPIGKPRGPAPLIGHHSLAERVELLKAEPFVDIDRSTETCIVCIRPGCDGKNVELDKRYPLQLSNWRKHCRNHHGNAIEEDPKKSQAGGSVGPPEKSGLEKENAVTRLARKKAQKKMMMTRPKGLGRVICKLPDKSVLPLSLRRKRAKYNERRVMNRFKAAKSLLENIRVLVLCQKDDEFTHFDDAYRKVWELSEEWWIVFEERAGSSNTDNCLSSSPAPFLIFMSWINKLLPRISKLVEQIWKKRVSSQCVANASQPGHLQ